MSETTTEPSSPPAPAPVQRQPEYTPPQQPTSREDTVANLRAEAAAYRTRARDAREERDAAVAARDQAVAALEAARRKAAEDATAPLTARLERATQRTVSATLRAALVSEGLRDPDLISLVSGMPDAPKMGVDEEFNVTGVEETVRAFKKWKPDYFGAAAVPPPAGSAGGGAAAPGQSAPPPQSTGAGNEPPPSVNPPVVDVSKMTKADYAKYKSNLFRDLRSQGTGIGGFGR